MAQRNDNVLGRRALAVALLAALAIAGAGTEAPARPAADAGRGLQVSVDPRVELMSIIFRLAGNPEYNQGRVDAYAADVDAHFGPHQGHRVIALARSLRRHRGISFDAPMSLACRLTDAYALEPRLPLDAASSGLDARWREEDAAQFLELARRFVEDTSFRAFMEAHAPLFEETERRAEQMLEENAELDWFDGFFGARPEASFHFHPALLNGPCSYGPHVRIGDSEEYHCMLGVWKTDGEGAPAFDRSVVDVVVHEFCHSYANPLVEAHLDAFQPAATRIFEHVGGYMREQAYGHWTSMMYESVVRAAVVRYLAATDDPGVARKQIRDEVQRGFLWMEGLSALLEAYEADRETYPTLEAFMPEVVAFFEDYARARFPEE